MLRRYAALVLLIIVSALVGACGFGADTPEATPLPAAATAPSEGGPAGGGPVVITFAVQEHERQVFAPLIETFNKENPDVRVQIVPLDEVLQFGPNQPFDPNEFTRRIVSAADTAMIWSIRAEDIKNGYLTDLTPLMDADTNFDRQDFFPGALESASQGGGTYMLPRTLRVPLISYNKDLWAARGLPPPRPDWSWKDMIGAAGQLAEKRGDTVEVYGLIDWSGGFSALYSELAAAGVNLFATPAGQLRLDDPNIVAAVERVASLAQSGAIYVPGPGEDGTASSPEKLQDLIIKQQAGLWQPDILMFGGPEPKEPDFAVGTLPYPATELPFFGGSQGYIMSSGTQHPQEAWRWLSFLSRQEIKQPFEGPTSSSEVPARKSIAEQSGFWKKLDEETAAAIRAALERPARALPSGSFEPQVYEVLDKALKGVIAGEKQAADALREAQATLEERLAKAQLTPQPTPGSGRIVVATPVPDVAPAGATEIVFSSFGFDTGQIRRIAREFNQQNPDIFVHVKSTDTFSGPVTLQDIASNSDCFTWWGAPDSDQFTATLDLQPLLDADASFPRDDYPAALLQPFRQGSGLYGLPYTVDFRVLNYNQTAFKEAGLAPPNANWTLDDFLNAAQQLTSGDGRNKRYGFASIGSQTEDLRFFLKQLDVSITSESGGSEQPNYTDPKVIQAVTFFLDLLRHYSPHEKLQGYTSGGWSNDAFQLVFEGRVGMWFEFGIRFFGGGPQRDFVAAIAPPPLGNRPIEAGDFNTTGLHISAQSKHADACWTWFKYLSSDVSGLQGRFPARISVAGSEAFARQAPPGAAEVYAAYRAALEKAPSTDRPRREFAPKRVYVDEYWFYRAVDRALQGEDLERGLAEAQRLTEAYLACARGGTDASTCATQVDPDYDGFNKIRKESGASQTIVVESKSP